MSPKIRSELCSTIIEPLYKFIFVKLSLKNWKMAFLRKYEYLELLDTLELKFFLHHDSKSPALVILYGVHDGFFCVRKRPSISELVLHDEIHRIESLLEYPHWRSFIDAHKVTYNDELFSSSADS